MAISKILCMKDTGKSYHGKSLKNAIDYIIDPEKTDDGRLVQGLNCLPNIAFEQMKQTKQSFGKLDKRQGYHLILSFKEGEVEADMAMEITRKFAEEYLGKEFEAIYAVHNNTDIIHSHIIYNSVSFLTGRKYRYEKGDWANEIQPLMNRLCREYGLSELEFDQNAGKRPNPNSEWSVRRDGKFVWGDMIKRDLDSCILQASSMDEFFELLMEKGYELKNAFDDEHGKYLAVKPPGMSRFKRCKSLGEDYSREHIESRIEKETMDLFLKQHKSTPHLVRCKIKRYRRAKLSGMQKRYFAKLYRLGQLKKKPYSQAWKYRDDIKKMHQYQKQYLFLVHNEVRNVMELMDKITQLEEKKKAASKEKSSVYRARSKCESLFAIADQMKELVDCENCFQRGESFFEEEHGRWEDFSNQLAREGYSYEEVVQLRQFYKEKYSFVCKNEKEMYKELQLAKSILKENQQEEANKVVTAVMNWKEEERVDKERKTEENQETRQPKR